MKKNLRFIVTLSLCAIFIFVLSFLVSQRKQILNSSNEPISSNILTMSGKYVCLPHVNTNGPQTTECAYGIETAEGKYYAVNFGQSAESMEQFRFDESVTLEGYVTSKDSLSTDVWQKYNMEGVFTVIKTSGNDSTGEIDVEEVCLQALAYMTFPDGESADLFLKDCVEGKYPDIFN